MLELLFRTEGEGLEAEREEGEGRGRSGERSALGVRTKHAGDLHFPRL